MNFGSWCMHRHFKKPVRVSTNIPFKRRFWNRPSNILTWPVFFWTGSVEGEEKEGGGGVGWDGVGWGGSVILYRSQIHSLWLGGYSQLRHRVVVPARQSMKPGAVAGRYENPMPELTLSPQSGTLNSDTGECILLLYNQLDTQRAITGLLTFRHCGRGGGGATALIIRYVYI